MSEAAKKDLEVVVLKSHVVSKEGATLKVERLELSKAGTRLITSTSKSIPDGQALVRTKNETGKRASAAAESK